jgi:hypothetical protein
MIQNSLPTAPLASRLRGAGGGAVEPCITLFINGVRCSNIPFYVSKIVKIALLESMMIVFLHRARYRS